MNGFSLLIIVKNRRNHLENVLRALSFSTVQPKEIIIVHMNQVPYNLKYQGLRALELATAEPLPLAKARNLAATSAITDKLIFLDVDCIPKPDCFEILLRDLKIWQLSMVDPRYLTQTVENSQAIDFDALKNDATLNPARKNLNYGLTDRYEMFWSLGFAITKHDFEMIGGFDEQFVGYGGEDTDFAFSARQQGISLGMSRAIVYHQNHPSYDPPLNWLGDIVTNANRFYQKWGQWPMEGWLREFAKRRYIEWSKDAVRVVKPPSQQEIHAAHKEYVL